MKKQNEKMGLFERLTGIKNVKKESCCGNFELEEVLEDKGYNDNDNLPQDKKSESCCK